MNSSIGKTQGALAHGRRPKGAPGEDDGFAQVMTQPPKRGQLASWMGKRPGQCPELPVKPPGQGR